MTWAPALVATVALAACGGGSGSGDGGSATRAGTTGTTSAIGASQNAAADTVPDNATASGTSMIKFLKSMRNDDETSEPMSMSNGATVPADETSEAES